MSSLKFQTFVPLDTKKTRKHEKYQGFSGYEPYESAAKNRTALEKVETGPAHFYNPEDPCLSYATRVSRKNVLSFGYEFKE